MTKTRTQISCTLAIAGLAFSMVAGGCGEPEPEPAPVVNRPPPPPPAPVPVEVSTLMTQMSADPRVQFPQRLAPTDEGLARAVITLASAIASGDHTSARSVLSAEAQNLLDALVSSGDWAGETEGVEAVRVVELSSDGLTLAVQDPRGAYPLAWSIASEGGTVFTGKPVPAVVLRRASDFDDGIPEPAATGGAASSAVAGGGGFRTPTLARFAEVLQQPEVIAVAGRFQVAHNAWMSGLDPIGFTLNLRLGDRWNKKIGIPVDLTSDTGKGLAATQLGLTLEQVNERLEQGGEAIDGGERPSPEVMLATLESFTGLPGFPQRESDVISEMAAVLDTTSAEVTSLIEQGRASGSSPFTEFVQAAEANASSAPDAEPQAEDEDDGRIIKQTPAGPLEIPVPPGNG